MSENTMSIHSLIAGGKSLAPQRGMLNMDPLILGLISLVLIILAIWRSKQSKRAFILQKEKNASKQNIKIEPVEDFELGLTKPPVFRPFKPKYHLTMGRIESLNPNDLLVFDQSYLERLPLRQSLLEQYSDEVVGVTDESNARIRIAVEELYTYLFKTYLPARYPSLFKLCSDCGSHHVQNVITQKTIATELGKSSSLCEALALIAENIDEDFFILLPHKREVQGDSKDDVYVLEAYAACFPSGFKPKDKIGKKLAEIHGPIPGYKQKLEKSMDRFFARLEAGRLVKRVNWSLTVDEELYSNFDKGQAAFDGKLEKIALGDLNLDKTFLRCERQTLHRLPRSNAIVFAFHTYLYPIQDVKDEGSGEDLAIAIDGLQGASVPEIFTYKNGDQWGDAVRQFLRS